MACRWGCRSSAAVSTTWACCKPAQRSRRPGWFTTPAGDKLVGWLTAYVALMLILPGPGTNGPPAFGNIVMALGLVEADNRTLAWGVGLTVAGCAFATAVLVVLGWLGFAALGMLF